MKSYPSLIVRMDNLIEIKPIQPFAEYIFSCLYSFEEWEDFGQENWKDCLIEKDLYDNWSSLLNHFGLPSDFQTVSNFCYLSELISTRELSILKSGGYEVDRFTYPVNKELIALKSFLELTRNENITYEQALREMNDGDILPIHPKYTVTFKTYGKDPQTLELNLLSNYFIELLKKDLFSSLPVENISHSNEREITSFLKKAFVVIDKVFNRIDYNFKFNTEKFEFIEHIFFLSNIDLEAITSDPKKYIQQLARRAKEEGLYSLIEDPTF